MKKSLISLCLGGLGIGTTEFLMMGLLPDIAKTFDVSIPTAGHLISSYALGVVVGAPVLTILAGNLPAKKVLLGLMSLFTIFNALAALSPSFTMLMIARFFAGLPHGAFFGIGSVAAKRLATKGKEAQALSVMFAGLTIANLAGVPFGTYLGHNYSWRYSFGMVAFIGLIALSSIYFWMPNLKNEAVRNIKKELEFFKQRTSWLLIVITSIGTGGLFCWISYIAPLITNVTYLSSQSVSSVLILAGVGMVIGNIIGGKLSDKIGPRKASITLLSLMMLSLLCVHFFSANKYSALFFTFTSGAMAFALVAPMQLLMMSYATGAEMLAAAACQAALNIGNALGAFFGGLPIIYHYNYSYPAYVGAAMALTGVFLCMILKKQKC